jgi:DNA-binding transcriptional MerR regulator
MSGRYRSSNAVSIDGGDFLRAGNPGARRLSRAGVSALLFLCVVSRASKGVVVQAKSNSAGSDPNDKFDDEDYPAYSMGSAARILGTTPGFLRSLDEAKLLTPQRSEGGHRRYSRYQLRIAARARELVDRGTALEAACRIIILEDQLTEAQAINAELQRSLDAHRAPPDG